MEDDNEKHHQSVTELPVPAPAFAGAGQLQGATLRRSLVQAIAARFDADAVAATRKNDRCDLDQFLKFAGIDGGQPEQLLETRPEDVPT